MRTKNFLKHLILGVLVLTTGKMVGQATVTGNVAIAPTNFLGWDATSPANDFPLRVRHDGNFPIHFFTDTRFRMLLNESVTYPTLGSFPFVPADGFALITPTDDFLTTSPKGPFSRLHLAEGDGDNTQSIGYRPWQRNGITFTGNADQGYIGHKYAEELEDITDMVIQWSDNPGFEHADRMRFIFTSAHNELSSTGAASEEGLEGMRLWPKNFKEINVGVGDFFADGTDPTERLHVLDGRVRIEELPHPDFEALETFKVMVVDDAAIPSDERGVVKWKELDDLLEADCEWTINQGANNHVFTALGVADPNCPDASDAVGIGTDPTTLVTPAKLNVTTAGDLFRDGIGVSVNNTGNAFGGRFLVTGGSNSVRGVQTITNGSSNVAIAGDFNSNDTGTNATGVSGVATAGGTVSTGVGGRCTSNGTFNYGTYGEVLGSGSVNAGIYGDQRISGFTPAPNGNYGVFGSTLNQVLGTDWAGYFRGNVTVTGIGIIPGGTWTPSDENLKENITDLPDAMDVIAQLNPKAYAYRADALPQVGLPSGQQFGFLAQELEAVIPEAVQDITFQAQLDSAGQEIYPAVPTKIVNTDMMIPFLVAGMQEQQATIAAQNDRIDQLENAIANCCNPFSPGGEQALPPQQGGTPDLLNDRSMKVVPNPFQNETTIHYNLERGGRVQLMANSADGKQLQVLYEQVSESGVYQFNWHTADLAAGMYYVTLLLDGEAITKRAVKIDR